MPDSNITKKALATAMKEQMAKTPFSKISVGDICDACGMNRKSFYYHFKDKYDLVNWIFYTEFIETMHLSAQSNGWGLLEEICSYFYRERVFYCNALQIQGQNSLYSYFLETMTPFLEVLSREMFPQLKHISFFSVSLLDAFLSTIVRWLTEEPQITPDIFLAELKCFLSGFAKAALQSLDETEL